jgi:hypothetical protein
MIATKGYYSSPLATRSFCSFLYIQEVHVLPWLLPRVFIPPRWQLGVSVPSCMWSSSSPFIATRGFCSSPVVPGNSYSSFIVTWTPCPSRIAAMSSLLEVHVLPWLLPRVFVPAPIATRSICSFLYILEVHVLSLLLLGDSVLPLLFLEIPIPPLLLLGDIVPLELLLWVPYCY